MSPDGGARPLRWMRLASWQLAQVLTIGTVFVVLRRGSLSSLVAGAAMLLASMVLTRLAVSFALRPNRRPAVGVALFLLKLAALLVLVVVGLRGMLLGPMSFAIGATTLPVAIVLDACYPSPLKRRPFTAPPD